MLRDLTIQNYRCFEDFQIDGLEQVNLFVGNNNSGKTSLLEAIYLLVNKDKEQALSQTILNRIDFFDSNEKSYYAADNIFYDYKLDIPFPGIAIYQSNNNGIGINFDQKYNSLIYFNLEAPNYPETKYLWKKVVSFDIGYSDKLEYDAIPSFMYQRLSYIDSRTDNIIKELNLAQEKGLEVADSIIISAMHYNKICSTENNYIAIERKKNTNDIIPYDKQPQKYSFLAANKISFNKLAVLWDSISLTIKEELVTKAIQILDENTLKIDFPSQRNSNLIRIKLKNQDNPVPLSNMGEGMYRILALAMSLVTAENGVLLVDEIETGLHYEAQTDMWRLILETAKELNVQVFATTHSWDCIAAYQEALSQVEDQSIGKLFRLDSKYGKLRAVEYNAEDLDIAVRNSIEVR